jgi:hypothetical protein
MARVRKAVENNHGLCPDHPARTTPNDPGPHIFQHPTNLSPTWCLLCGGAPAVTCAAHDGRHAWAAECVNPVDADSPSLGTEGR